MDNSDYITLDELCHILSIGKTKAYELVRENKITSCKIAKKWMIPKEAVNDYVKAEIEHQKNE